MTFTRQCDNDKKHTWLMEFSWTNCIRNEFLSHLPQKQNLSIWYLYRNRRNFMRAKMIIRTVQIYYRIYIVPYEKRNCPKIEIFYHYFCLLKLNHFNWYWPLYFACMCYRARGDFFLAFMQIWFESGNEMHGLLLHHSNNVSGTFW